MNFRVYILAIAAFVVGMVELIVGGILNLIAEDLQISISSAGQFITIFSIAFAISGPILINVTAKMERKKLYLYMMTAFMISNLIVAFTSSYAAIIAARALSAMSGSVIIVLSVSMAASLVPESHKGRAIGIIYMGISGSLVLGVPLGMVIGNAYGWRAPFLVIAILSLLSMAGIALFTKRTAPNPVVPLREQLALLKNSKIVSAQLIVLLMLTGHLTLYGYLQPYVQSTFNVSPGMMSVVYFLFGIAAVTGGGFGGWIADRFGTKRSILAIVACFSVSMFMVMLTAQISFWVFLIAMMIWSALSWAISPAQQTYLLQLAPDNAETQLSLNSSMLHLGIASGSIIGSTVIEKSSVANNPWVGGIIAAVAFGVAFFSLTRRSAPAKDEAAASSRTAEQL
ncbi:MFS transporter, DHA1 family, putative efflux transporter [Paenibacillus uliginis N3/975]|uniref:MFS transporter, DHA1 family, putative efflux transporter n=1 Tax=Paenibacillus uliginis N3/975 TaxID=1313296 RepID=A0A1X7G6N5_9BACL|nr:MFS transporter [Paenibacillus uliginis]SMF65023.1 MFS transporter, DHA1 family, putative efflux transporter [Paenibacillus uliginis N3/975]